MRSALLFVLFAIITQKLRCEAASDEDFRPTPIPINYWTSEEHDNHGNTLDESKSGIAVIPAHYWEDALRHSVYLTLVRDKIDQLIAQGDVITPNIRPDAYTTKEVDDHDLWEKIKKAPFDRIEAHDPPSLGDVVIMSKGRLVDDGKGYRFTEDDMHGEKCRNSSCMEGVKAVWSVKRERQRDDLSSGKYHYELTFSVVTQAQKKQRRPYENPTRTFTVRETGPETIAEKPLEHRTHTARPERAIWVHKNIVPAQRYHSRQYQNGLDRLFTSWFSDDDDYVQRYKPSPPKYVQPTYPQSQYSKIGYVGAPTETHQQKKPVSYSYKPHAVKYSHPPPPPPSSMPQPHPHHYLDTDSIGVVSAPYVPQYPEHKYHHSGKPLKQGRPPVLPTPVPIYVEPVNSTLENTSDIYAAQEIHVTSTKVPDIITGYRPKPTQMKVSYYAEHARPPVYNAPPGVFVTMDKKPFKPMPPLRLHHSSKPIKAHKPIDFRPSPQVLDVAEFSEPDPLSENAFRPINLRYNDTTTERIEVIESSKPIEQVVRKSNTTRVESKPKKKYENKKSPTFTTTIPDIITAHISSEEDGDSIQWANLLGAFSKTTPIGSQRDQTKDTESTTTPLSTTSSSTTAKPTTRRTTTTTEKVEETSTTTAAPIKRTRPPPKFTKPVKPKKHKRVTSTTTKAPERFTPKRPQNDLTPQASSAAASKLSTKWSSSSTTPEPTLFSTTSTTTRQPTTTAKITSTTETSTASTTEASTPTEKPKNKNRYRQSTLMHKGTSVKHDKWSGAEAGSVKIRNPVPSNGSFPPRRKGSNFQGYVKSTTAQPVDEDDEYYEEIPTFPVTIKISSTTEAPSTKSELITNSVFKATQESTYEETVDRSPMVSESQAFEEIEDESNEDFDTENMDSDENEEDEEEKQDRAEFMFYSNSTTRPSDKSNEINDEEHFTTEITAVASPYATPKNKTKCKKKQQLATTPETLYAAEEEVVEPSATTTASSTSDFKEETSSDIFDELFGGFFNETKEKDRVTKGEPQEGESENHDKYVKPDDDFFEALGALDDKYGGDSLKDELVLNEDDADASDRLSDSEENSESSREIESYEDAEEDSPFSLFELMAME